MIENEKGKESADQHYVMFGHTDLNSRHFGCPPRKLEPDVEKVKVTLELIEENS